MGIFAGLRGSMRRKLGRCLACLRVAVGGAIVAGAASAGTFFASSVAGWTLAAVAIAFAVVAVAHLATLAARVGTRAAFRALVAVSRRLGCGCDDVPVGYGLKRWYATKEQCEEDGIPAAYGDARDQADGFCNKTYYECIDKDCPWLHWVNPTSTRDCTCEQADDGQWQAICNLLYKTQCCCSPEL
jgi:hypothetical protein